MKIYGWFVKKDKRGFQEYKDAMVFGDLHKYEAFKKRALDIGLYDVSNYENYTYIPETYKEVGGMN